MSRIKQDRKIDQLNLRGYKVNLKVYKGINSEFDSLDLHMGKIDRTYNNWGLLVSSVSSLPYFKRKKNG